MKLKGKLKTTGEVILTQGFVFKSRVVEEEGRRFESYVSTKANGLNTMTREAKVCKQPAVTGDMMKLKQ